MENSTSLRSTDAKLTWFSSSRKTEEIKQKDRVGSMKNSFGTAKNRIKSEIETDQLRTNRKSNTKSNAMKQFLQKKQKKKKKKNQVIP